MQQGGCLQGRRRTRSLGGEQPRRWQNPGPAVASLQDAIWRPPGRPTALSHSYVTGVGAPRGGGVRRCRLGTRWGGWRGESLGAFWKSSRRFKTTVKMRSAITQTTFQMLTKLSPLQPPQRVPKRQRRTPPPRGAPTPVTYEWERAVGRPGGRHMASCSDATAGPGFCVTIHARPQPAQGAPPAARTVMGSHTVFNQAVNTHLKATL